LSAVSNNVVNNLLPATAQTLIKEGLRGTCGPAFAQGGSGGASARMGAMAQDALEPDAFKKLYPDQYYARFVAEGLRPDGRPLARARPTTIALGAVSTADSSALVKIGSTTVMAGIKLEARAPPAAPRSVCVRKDVMASALFLGQACRHGKAYPALVLTGRGPLLVFRLPHVTRFPDRLQAFQAPACADRGMLAQVMVPTDERPQEGQLALSVELSALCSPDARPGRFSEAANCLNEQARVAAQRPQVASAQVC